MDNGASSYRRFREDSDNSAFDEIIMEYCDGLMLYLTSVVGNIQIAEELAENTFVLLGTKKPNFKGKSSFKTWLYAIGRNIALNYLKKNKINGNVSIDEISELISDEKEIEETYIKKEQQIIVHKAMRKLNPIYQQVLWLVFFEELSTKETAKVMKKSVRSIESILYRAKKSLKSQLEMEGYEYEET